MSSSTDQTSLNHKQIWNQTFGILNSNCLHFIPISLLFLPFTFVVSATIQFYFSTNDVTNFDPFNLLIIKTIITHSQDILTLKSLTTILAFIFLVILPAVAGTALITYGTNQSMHLRRLTFSSMFKSLSNSYIHLLSTFIYGSVKLVLLFLLLTLSPIAIAKGVNAFGFHFRPFIFLIVINQIASYVLVITIVFFMVIWGSAASIAVVESKSGYESLQQSANQSKEFRSHSFLILFLTGYTILPSFSCRALAQNQSTTNWIFILQVCTACLLSSLLILYYVVANTVLYVQCKVARGKDVTKTTVDGDVYDEYVSVAVNEKDDELVSHELAMGNANYGCFTFMLYLLAIVLIFLMTFMLLQHA